MTLGSFWQGVPRLFSPWNLGPGLKFTSQIDWQIREVLSEMA